MNFLNALEKMPGMIEKYERENEKIAISIPVLESVINGTWSKEEELKELKVELQTLDRKIQLSLKPIEEHEVAQEPSQATHLTKPEMPAAEGMPGQSQPIVPPAPASSLAPSPPSQTDGCRKPPGRALRTTHSPPYRYTSKGAPSRGRYKEKGLSCRTNHPYHPLSNF